ncbi:hypothetical protein CBR_g26196 [Chara braunii]|uniref:BEACH domain-containing protein n=1 Tax=Chara braunii TaxID=69332 RepID=A0A388L7A6_CHABU|nr:hypothetical protein CBR_g26196 [Chara braunii]|eukprot:GBG78164.1 hypothetical protein CBR_g26196 [Chara braunii]
MLAGAHRRPAEVLGHVHIATRVKPADSLWAMGEGGPLATLPLVVGSLEKETLQPCISDVYVSAAASMLSAPLLRVIARALLHPGNMDEVARINAPRLLAHLLSHVLTVPAAADHHHSVSSSANSAKNEKRDEEMVVAVISLVQASKANEVSGSSVLKLNAVRPAGQLNTLVDELLVVVELLVGSGSGITAEADVRCLIHFVLDCSQPNQVARVLHLIYRLVVQPNTGRAAAFAEMFLSNGGSEMMLALLRKEADMGETPAYIPPCAQEGPKHVAGENDSAGSGLSSARSSGGETPVDSTGHGSFSGLSRSSALSGSLSVESLSSKEGRFPNLTITMPEKTKSTGTLSYTSPRVSGMMSPSMSPSFRSSKLLGGIQLSVGPGNSNAFRNVDGGDGIMLGIISLVGALVSGGYLYLSSPLSPTGAMAAMGVSTPTGAGGDQSRGGLPQVGASVGVWYVYAIQRAFQAAPKRLLTDAVYTVLLSAILRSEVVTNNPEALYDVGHRFQNTDLLSALLQSLPMAPKNMQMRALQDILLLTCTHQDNRNSITSMPEWPEWLLEILLSNYETISDDPDEVDMTEAANELVYGFLSIILEHSMRSRDGWKEVEAIIHCLDWLAEVGGSNLPDRRLRRDQAVPKIKRAILGSLMEFATYELKVQTQVVAAVAAGVASEGLSPRAAKAEAEAAAQLPLYLAENSLVLLMLVEDFLRAQCHAYGEKLKSASSKNMSGTKSPVARLLEGVAAGGFERTSSLGFERLGSMDRPAGDMADEHDGVSLEDLAAMADSDGRISTAAMERIAASAAAEPYESVRCAFASYGSLGSELGHGWRTRSRLWYGVGLPSRGGVCPGGGCGWEAWMNTTERDEDGEWVDLTLVRKAVDMLSSLLLEDTSYSGGPGSGAMSAIGIVPGVSGHFNSAGGGLAPGVQGLQQIVDSDQPFFAMLRIVLVSMREEDKGGEPAGNIVMDRSGELGPNGRPIWSPEPGGRQSQGACLLRCVLAPLMNTPISGERRQRVLVAACIMYTEVWHAVSVEHEPIRRQYLELLLPPFAHLLRRWRPLLAGIHGLTDYEGQSPIAFEDKALSTDVTPLEAALAMISPGWGAAFASPPAAMALAMAAAGAGYGGENSSPMNRGALRRTSELESPTGGSGSGSSGSGKLLNFKDMNQNAPKERTTPPLDRAAAKAAAMAAARDKERKAKIGAKRGWGAVAMCTSGQRRAESDDERFKRWNIQEAIAAAWAESAHDAARLPGFDRLSSPVRGSSGGSTLAMLVEGARRMRYAEVNRRAMASAADDYSVSLGARGWRSLIRRLLESDSLYGAISRPSWPVHVFWKLDTMENRLRQRKRLKTNYKGTDHLGAAADSEIVAAVKKSKAEMPEAAPALSPEFAAGSGAGSDVAEESERYSEDSLMSPDARPSMDGSEASVVSPSRQPASTAAATAAAVPGVPGLTPTVMATMATTVMTEVNERVVVEVPAALVQPLKVQKGRFQVTTKRICFIVDDTINMDTPSVEESTTGDDWELIGDGASSAVRSCQHRRDGADDRSWPLSSLREIHSRRYLLRLSALELFMVDRSNFFFNFMGSDERRRVYRALLTVRPPYLNNVFGSTQRPERLLKKLQLMERWSRREISNFEYLMQLNTLAGRSYNDITQYPVFPWVLQDYSSGTLDLNDPSVFRDLSKPIGALNPVRLEKFLERYDNLDDPLIPKFHYGSHYSNAGTVLYYLLRVEPYTSLAVQLQGGKFDHADRMFGDVGATWRGVLEDMSDVKELVPEFFFLPEMFINQNSLDLGRTQKGEILGDVSLPPWADNAIDFVQKHRAALESEYVSAHLHEWIDLIFGYKQRGPHAITAANVFYYITYDGAVDIDKISDPVQRKATQDQIAYFGQTPAQLLTTPHQPRLSVHEAVHLQTIFRNPSAVCSYAIGGQDRLNVPAVQLCATSETIVTVQGPAPACHVAVHRWQPNTPDDRGIPFKFQHGRTFSSSGSGALMRMFSRGPAQTPAMVMYPRIHTLPAPGINKYAVVAITADGRHLLTGGHGDCSLKLVDVHSARVAESAYAHCSPISCLALSPDGSILVTGSKFAMAILWRIHRTSGSNSGAHASAQDPSMVAIAASAAGSSGIPSSPHMPSDAEGELIDNSGSNFSRRKCIEGPLHVLRGHVDELICCAVNADLDLVATCSKTKGVLLHTIMRGRHLTFGFGCGLLFGCEQMVQRFELPDDASDVTALALTEDNTNLIVSTSDMQLLVYTDPRVSVIKTDQMLRLGWEGAGLSGLMT